MPKESVRRRKNRTHLHSASRNLLLQRRSVRTGQCSHCGKAFSQTLITHLRRNPRCLSANAIRAVELEANEEVHKSLAPLHVIPDASIDDSNLVGPVSFIRSNDDIACVETGLKNATELKFMNFILSHNMSRSMASELLRLIQESPADDVKQLPRTVAPLYKKLDAKLVENFDWGDGVAFTLYNVPIPDHIQHLFNDLKFIAVPIASPGDSLTSFFKDLAWEDVILPEGDLDGPPPARGDLHTGDAIRRLTKNARLRHCRGNLHVIGLIIYIDSATTGPRGPRTYTTVVVTYSIAKRGIRNKKESKRLMMYVPKLYHVEDMSSEGTRMLIHICIDFLLSQYKPWCESPFPLTFTSKQTNGSITKEFVVRPLLIIADFMVAQLVVGHKMSVMAQEPCRRCRVKRDKLFVTSTRALETCSMSEVLKMRTVMLPESDATKSQKAKANKWLQEHSIQPEFPGLSACFGAKNEEEIESLLSSPPPWKFETLEQMIASVPFELLHAWLLGAPMRICQLSPLLLGLSGEQKVRKEGLSEQQAVKEYDLKVRSFKSRSAILMNGSIRYIPTFKNASSVSFMKAHEFRFLSQMLVAVLLDAEDFFIPSFAKLIRKVVINTYTLGALLFDGRLWDSVKVKTFESKVNGYGELFREVFGRVSNSDCAYIKLHFLGSHIIEDIKEFGDPENFSAETFESTHGEFVKQAFYATNGAKAEITELRMLRGVLRRQMVRSAMLSLTEDVESISTINFRPLGTLAMMGERGCAKISKVAVDAFKSFYRLWTWESSAWDWASIAPNMDDKTRFPLRRFGIFIEDRFEAMPPTVTQPLFANRWEQILSDNRTLSVDVQFYTQLHAGGGIVYRCDREYYGNSKPSAICRYDIVPLSTADEGGFDTVEDCWYGELLLLFKIVCRSGGGGFMFIRYLKDIPNSKHRAFSPFRQLTYESSKRYAFSVISIERLALGHTPVLSGNNFVLRPY